jgi:hypothetical protein
MPSHAEASFTGDPLVAHLLLARTVAGGARTFAEALGAALPQVKCHLPAPGDLVPL